MGISDGPQGSSGVDCSVGSIVWVRRRNGSWWPGRILGTNELSASHLMSPRSGTPVKLLGREDASVDWYNLEKSKRVKAFRCGEFDDCIERAESSQGIPIKKREKYARREDAILHALELERQQLEKQQQNLGIDSNCVSSKIPGGLDNELSTSPERLENAHGKVGRLKSYQLSKSLDLPLEEESMGNPLYAQKFKQGKQRTWEDENAEATPRMRGLQDFGLRIASSKGKFSSSVTSDGSRNHTLDNDAHVLPSSGRSIGGLHQVNIGKNLLLKRKGSLGGSSEESLVKRRDRRRPLVQVLQSSAKLSVPNSLQYDGEAASLSMSGEEEQAGIVCRAKRSKCVYLPADSNDFMDQIEFPSNQMSPSQFAIDNYRLHPGSSTVENTSSGLKEDVESDSSEGDYLNPDMEEEMVALSDAATFTDAEPRNSGRYGFRGQQPGSMSNEEPDEWALTGYMSHQYPHGQSAAVAVDVGVSKWPLKGKRNTRNLLKRPAEVTDVKESNDSIHGKYLEGKGIHSSEKESSHAFYHKTEALNYGYDEDDLIEKDFQTEMEGFGNRRRMLMSKAAPSDRSRIGHNIIGLEDSIWEADGLSQSTFGRYWDDPDECFDQVYVGHHIGKGIDSKLVEVDLKVQASSYQGEHVPLVSLMSRLNGKAIIGHPIQVEELEDGSSDILLSSNDYFGDGMVSNNSGTALPPVWRTARRTAMHRVPRPQALSAVEDDEAADYLHYSDNECKSLYAKSYAGNFGPKERQNSKRFSQLRHPATEKKLPKKLLKKASLSNQKTRTLSSIAIEQKHPGKGSRPDARKSCTDGLIKPGETGPTTVTCIPVKLVFSRLLEAVGRQPSRPANYGVLMNGNKEREPS